MYRYVNYGGDTGHIERSRCMGFNIHNRS